MVKAAILHEGNDKDTTDKKLIKSLLENLKLDVESIFFDGFGSKSNFFDIDNKKYLRLKSFVEAGQIEKILFIVDADHEKDDAKYKGYQNTENQLKRIIHKLDFQDIARFYLATYQFACALPKNLI